MQVRTLKIIATLLIISAIVMGVIGYKISQQDSNRNATPVAAAPANTGDIAYAQKVVVVSQNIAKGTTLTKEMLELVPFPIPVDDAFSQQKDLINKKTEYALHKGDVLRLGHFVKQSPLTSDIREGYRAIAVDVDEVVGTGGFLVPGDHVDIIFTTRASKETYNKSLSRRILGNIRLLAYGSDIGEQLPDPVTDDKRTRKTDDKNSGKRSRSAVLEVSIKDINTLTLAENSGKLRLVAVGERDINSAINDESDSSVNSDNTDNDTATFIRSVTGLKPPTAPKSVYVYSGDQVETVRVPK